MKNLIYGAAYYEEYAQGDRLERDMELIAAAGMNTIRIAESTWSVEEPRCGEFDFSHVLRTVEAAARRGIRVIVGTPTYAIPKWLYDLDPTILGENKFGPRQNMDITNPTYRFYAERVIRELVSRTAGLENVIGFQIDNETKHYGVNNARVLSGFRAWLQRRFGSIEKLNEAYLLNHWSNSLASFDELPDPAGAVNGGYACAFEEYRRELAADFLRWQEKLVREYLRPDQFITHNLDYDWHSFGAPGQQNGYSNGLQPDMNHFEAARALTLAGTDIYLPAASELTGQQIAFGGDEMRPLKRAPYLVLESQSQAFPSWQPYPGQLRLMTLSHLACGALGQMYWPWASLHGGIEAYWKGILSHDGEPGEIYDEISSIGHLLQRIAPAIPDTVERKRIALLVSPEALHALRRFPISKDVSYNDVLNLWHRALYELNLECDILYDRESDWEGYQLLVVPALYCASDALIARLRAFVEGGGCVFAGFRSFFADENLRIRPDRQPHGLCDVFGVHYDRFAQSEARAWMELLHADEAEVLQTLDDPHWSTYAAFTHHRFGAGQAWYLGCTATLAELKDCLLQICPDAGIEPPALRFPLVCRRRENLLFLLNYSDAPQSFPSPASGDELLTGTAVAASQPLTLPPWGAMLLREA